MNSVLATSGLAPYSPTVARFPQVVAEVAGKDHEEKSAEQLEVNSQPKARPLSTIDLGECLWRIIDRHETMQASLG
jgi:hypothetical protein